MRPRHLLLAPLLLLGLLAPFAPPAQAAAPAPAAPATASDGDLPRGPDADLAWVERLAHPRGAALLHLRSGKEKRIGVPRNPAYSLRLVGATNAGWLVEQQRQGSVRLYAIGGRGGAHEISRAWDPDNGTYHLPSALPFRVLRWTRDRDGGSVAVVLSVRGEVQTRRRFPGEVGRALRWDGGGIRIALPERTCTWRPPEPAWHITERFTCVPVHSAVVAPGPDLALVETADGRYGPTSLSEPGTPAWDAAFVPSAVSTDGTLVAGVAHTATTRSEDLEVRRVADGQLLAVRELTHQVGDRVWFEKSGGGLVYLSGVPGRGYVLVRCVIDPEADALAGADGARCARASRYRREWGFAVQGTVDR